MGHEGHLSMLQWDTAWVCQKYSPDYLCLDKFVFHINARTLLRISPLGCQSFEGLWSKVENFRQMCIQDSCMVWFREVCVLQVFCRSSWQSFGIQVWLCVLVAEIHYESKAMDNIDGCQILHSEVGQASIAYYIRADVNSFCNTSYTIEVYLMLWYSEQHEVLQLSMLHLMLSWGRSA